MILEAHPDRPEKGIRAIGYWRPSQASIEAHPQFYRKAHLLALPDPRDHVEPNWDPEQRRLIAMYLKEGVQKFAWRGMSCCRICGIRNGSTCLTDGTFVWPQGFAHYIEEHGVRPPEEFVRHAMQTIQGALRDRC
jgi:hypothetical protein